MFNLAFSTTGDSHSSPFVDYLNDTLYVGDNNGYLFKIGGVFNGTPAKRTSASCPAWGDSSGALLVASSAGKFLTSPVLDYTDNKVWVGVGGTDGLLKFANVAVSPATVSSGLAVAASNSLNEGPIVDGTNHTVFTFTSDDSGITGGGQPRRSGRQLFSPVRLPSWRDKVSGRRGTLTFEREHSRTRTSPLQAQVTFMRAAGESVMPSQRCIDSALTAQLPRLCRAKTARN